MAIRLVTTKRTAYCTSGSPCPRRPWCVRWPRTYANDRRSQLPNWPGRNWRSRNGCTRLARFCAACLTLASTTQPQQLLVRERLCKYYECYYAAKYARAFARQKASQLFADDNEARIPPSGFQTTEMATMFWRRATQNRRPRNQVATMSCRRATRPTQNRKPRKMIPQRLSPTSNRASRSCQCLVELLHSHLMTWPNRPGILCRERLRILGESKTGLDLRNRSPVQRL